MRHRGEQEEEADVFIAMWQSNQPVLKAALVCVVNGYLSTLLRRNCGRRCYILNLVDKCIKKPCVLLFSKFECVSPLPAQKHGACFINFYSESKEECGRKSCDRWDAGIAKNLKYRTSRKKQVDVILCETCTQWK